VSKERCVTPKHRTIKYRSTTYRVSDIYEHRVGCLCLGEELLRALEDAVGESDEGTLICHLEAIDVSDLARVKDT
jgi:hypothetical protein